MESIENKKLFSLFSWSLKKKIKKIKMYFLYILYFPGALKRKGALKENKEYKDIKSLFSLFSLLAFPGVQQDGIYRK